MEIQNTNHEPKTQKILDDEYYTLFKVRKTVFRMLEDRGYRVFREPEMDEYDKFKDKFKLREDLVIMAGKEDGERIYVEFSNKEKVSLDTIKDIGLRLFNQKLRNGILIAKGTFTPICKQAILEMVDADIYLEAFEEKDLIVNITEHELVPKHIILSNEDKEQLLKKYKLTQNQLPKILLGDPISKYLGLKRYQVVKIVRPSETAGKYITYRIAV